MQTSTAADTSTGNYTYDTKLFDLDRLVNGRVDVHATPFPFFVAREQLSTDLSDKLFENFPQYSGAGYLPFEEEQCSENY